MEGQFRWGKQKFRRDTARYFFPVYKLQYVCHCLQKTILINELMFRINVPLFYQGGMKLRGQVLA